MTVSELYNKYPEYLVLHGQSIHGALDNSAKRRFIDRVIWIEENNKSIELSCYMFRHMHRFMNFGKAGIIIQNANIVRVFPSDGGTQRDGNNAQMSDEEIVKVLEKIKPEHYMAGYVEILVKCPIFKNLFFIQDEENNDYNWDNVVGTAICLGITNCYQIFKSQGRIHNYRIEVNISNCGEIVTLEPLRK